MPKETLRFSDLGQKVDRSKLQRLPPSPNGVLIIDMSTDYSKKDLPTRLNPKADEATFGRWIRTKEWLISPSEVSDPRSRQRLT